LLLLSSMLSIIIAFAVFWYLNFNSRGIKEAPYIVNFPGNKQVQVIVNEPLDMEFSHTDSKQVQISVVEECLPAIYDNYKSEVIKGKDIIDGFYRDFSINFGKPDEYADVKGITTFRGNNYRNSASYGHADVKEGKLEKVWSSKTGYIDTWTGIGWTGQPAIISWDENVKNQMNLFPAKKSKTDLKEVIYASLDGKIYFLDLNDGKPTRTAIDVGYPHKGSVAIDPRGLPLLFAGQGIPEKEGKQGPIGYRIYSLIDGKLLYFIDGYDEDALRYWGAFDSAPLIDKNTDTLIECGENGLLYTVNLNTKYDRSIGEISIDPNIVKYRYYPPAGNKIGTENSPAIYKNYIYFADNAGFLQCVDLNTLEPIWIRNVTDDTDSTIALEESDEFQVSLYTACELDIQGTTGHSFIRKINALSGELVWEKPVKCYYDADINGGAMASPVIGKEDISDLVIFNVARTEKNKNGSKLLALDKRTGEEVWVVDLEHYCWSSPVDIYTPEGKSYLIICDSGGFMRLLEGSSGKQLDCIQLESVIEASPAVYEDIVVVGTRGQKIWGIKIK
jgi:outer membrane protein assembly factor BamB